MRDEEKLINRTHWEQRYTEDVLPWDSQITPPEVEEFWQSGVISAAERQNAFAVDLGCGTGTNVTYLAELGLRAIGVELAENGLAIAQTRLRQHDDDPKHGDPKQGDYSTRISLIQASVTALPLRNVDPIYMLDIGCFHGIHPDMRAAYAADVCSLLAPGGYYHLYGFDWMEERANDPTKTPRGFHENEIAELFAPHLNVVEIQRATANPHPCRWYLLRKNLAP